MKYCKYSRRHFLQGAGGFALTLPFLPSLLEQEAFAEVPTNAKFFIHICSSHGGLGSSSFYPNTNGYQWTAQEQEVIVPGDVMAGTHHVGRHKRLAELLSGGQIAPIWGSDFNPFIEKMNLINGLSLMFGGGHHDGGYLGNNHGNAQADARTGVDANMHYVPPIPTLDQVIIRSPSFYGQNDPRTMPIVHMGDGSQSYKLINGRIQRVGLSWRMNDYYEYLFGDSGGQQRSPERLAIMDRVREDYQRVLSPASIGARISREDSQAISDHLDSLSEIRQRIQNLNLLASCEAVGVSQTRYGPSAPPSNDYPFSGNAEVFRARWDTYVSMLVTAINCGAVRAATVSLGVPTAYTGDYHQDIAHMCLTPEAQTVVRDSHRYVALNFLLPLIARLNDIPASSGRRLLDLGTVVYQPESCHIAHEGHNIQTAMWGSANGYYRMGRYYDFRNLNNRGLCNSALINNRTAFDPNHPYAEMRPGIGMGWWLHNFAAAMGVSRSEYLAIAGMPTDIPTYGYGDHTMASGVQCDFFNTVGSVTQRVTHRPYSQELLNRYNSALPMIKA